MATSVADKPTRRRRRAAQSETAVVTQLLGYQFATNPSPLQASTTATPSQGQLNVSVYNPHDAYCSRITIGVQLGGDATDLADTGNVPTASLSSGKWAISDIEVVDGRDLGLRPGAVAAYTFMCRDASDYQIDYDLVFALNATVNTAPGNFPIAIVEVSGTSATNMTRKNGVFTQTKVPPQFYLQNLVATNPSTPTVPVSQFANSKPILLEWESNGTWFELYSAAQSTPLYAGNQTSFSVSGGISVDTTFVLVGMVSGNPAGDAPQGGYKPIYLYETITLTVSNPDLTPRSVAVTSDGTSGGTISASGTATFGGSTTVGTSAQNAALTVNGGATVSGQVQAGSANVSGALGVTGVTTLGTVNAGSVNPASVSASGQVSAGSFSTGGNGQFGSVNSSGSIVAAGVLTASGGPITTGGSVSSNTGPYNTFNGNMSSDSVCSGYFVNNQQHSGNWVSGVASVVADGGDYGFNTNGYIGSNNGSAMVTHLETRDGFQVVTSPVSPAAEVHLSGHGELSNGQAQIQLDPAHADMLHFGGPADYRVLITPTGRCGGLAVTKKQHGHFVVEELSGSNSGGAGEAGFDWLLIAPKRAALGASRGAALPEAMPVARSAVSEAHR